MALPSGLLYRMWFDDQVSKPSHASLRVILMQVDVSAAENGKISACKVATSSQGRWCCTVAVKLASNFTSLSTAVASSIRVRFTSMSDNAVHYDAVVIGGGVAGLYAAYKLVRDGKTRVCVLEAKDSLGGRVRQIHGVAPWPLEAGPEFVHGAKSILVDVLQNDVGMKLHEKGWPDHIYWGGEQRLLPAEDPAHKTMDEVDRLMFEEVSH